MISDQRDDVKKLTNEGDLVLDGGFVVPGANAFGQTFRDYDADSERKDLVEENYRLNHIHQTVNFVRLPRLI